MGQELCTELKSKHKLQRSPGSLKDLECCRVTGPTLRVCCFCRRYRGKSGTAGDAAGTGPFGPFSLHPCPVQFLGLIQPALAGSDLGVLFPASPAQGMFHLSGLERGFNSY